MVNRKSGFTLVEIVLVMAIAGLILAMIFLALPQVGRTRRDTARKTDLGRLQTQIEFYGSNHSCTYPPENPPNSLSSNPDFCGGGTYAPAHFNDPKTGASYWGIAAANPGGITYMMGHGTACDGSTVLSSQRQFVLNMTLENGIACIDNL